ncbi:hypothetical protein CGRA01v4_12059 [Colletotrichum graminicola]|nr:hypothetical protein CGRA01v4_12059 [Colletotrichum graminicola]
MPMYTPSRGRADASESSTASGRPVGSGRVDAQRGWTIRPFLYQKAKVSFGRLVCTSNNPSPLLVAGLLGFSGPLHRSIHMIQGPLGHDGVRVEDIARGLPHRPLHPTTEDGRNATLKTRGGY